VTVKKKSATVKNKTFGDKVGDFEQQLSDVKGMNHLSQKEMKQLRLRLIEETIRLQELEESNADMTMNQEGNSDEADMASLDYSQSQILRLKNRGSFYSKKLQRSFQKIEAGEYGLCEECSAGIKFARLNARPTADLCIDCKEEAEREEMTWANPAAANQLGSTLNLQPN